MYENMDDLFIKLSKSKFRSSFKLKDIDIEYIPKSNTAHSWNSSIPSFPMTHDTDFYNGYTSLHFHKQ